MGVTPGGGGGIAGQTFGIPFSINGFGQILTTGYKGNTIALPCAGTLTGVYIAADQSGSVVLDIWKIAFASLASIAVGNSITASAKPTLSTERIKADTTLTGWTKTFAAGDCFGYNIDSVATITRLDGMLIFTRL